ncbi:hypothetical protein E2C01_053632 [Portunus trituberculatus]|uniref:Uncharacterized protein n=1 Tax=Portunus trituberculatus TaxID=210409 RepID=A0A5B7GRC2_PORTR|nr:hypothetical protein [Portunus trituberculatus]
MRRVIGPFSGSPLTSPGSVAPWLFPASLLPPGRPSPAIPVEVGCRLGQGRTILAALIWLVCPCHLSVNVCRVISLAVFPAESDTHQLPRHSVFISDAADSCDENCHYSFVACAGKYKTIYSELRNLIRDSTSSCAVPRRPLSRDMEFKKGSCRIN